VSIKRLDSILIKPAGPDCNLDCTYCFYLEKALLYSDTTVHRMSTDTLELLIKQIMEQSGNFVSIVWQGGEPSLMGLDFFKKAVEFQIKYGTGKSVANSFQTNGILLTPEWADFFKKYSFLVGLSIDGPRHIHDKYRLTKNIQPTWHTVYKTVKMLLKSKVDVNAMTCVTDYSVNFPEEIYNFHKELGLRWMQFIPIVETDKNNHLKAAPFSVSAEKYGEFLIKLFDLWQADFVQGKPATSVRWFDSVFYNYVGMPSPQCTLRKKCGDYVIIEHNGDVYSCDFFVEPKWKLGNIRNRKISSMLNSSLQQEFGENKSKVPERCMRCEWLKYCYGGCPKDRIRDPKDNGVSHFCLSYKMFFKHADLRLKEMAAEWIRENYNS